MSETLLLHYDPDAPETASWLLCNAQGEATTKVSSGTLAEVLPIARTHHVVVLLDSHCLHNNQLQLPTQNQQKMLRAVPYALEDFIAEDVEDFHFVITADKIHNRTAVAGIRKDTLKTIIDTLNEAGLTVDTIIPDALCMAADDTQWVILKHGDNCYFQHGMYSGTIFNTELIPYVLQQNLQQHCPEKILLFSHSDDDQTETLISNIQQTVTDNIQNPDGEEIDNTQNIEIIPLRYNSHPLVVFCGFYKQALALNLRRGVFKSRQKNNAYWPYWRLTAALSVIWLLLHLGLTAFWYNQLKQQNIAMHAQIRQIYEKTFPASTRIINPRVQMGQKLKALRNGGKSGQGLLYLLSESFGTLSRSDKNITLQSLDYRNNRMDIGLVSTNLQAIENLNKRLNDNPVINAQVTSSSSEKNRVKGILRIQTKHRGQT